jgi:hypothetical protein
MNFSCTFYTYRVLYIVMFDIDHDHKFEVDTIYYIYKMFQGLQLGFSFLICIFSLLVRKYAFDEVTGH